MLSEYEEHATQIVDKQCVTAILLSCFKTKDVKLETLKEIIRLFINLVLWRKIRKDNVTIACRLCDLGLMVDDIDVNTLAVFCLNTLAENVLTHSDILKSGVESFEPPEQ